MAPDECVKFLLVDDVKENLSALSALLRRDGLELYTANSACDALELLLVHDFALALLDVQMPDMDGFELAELMRGTERTRQIPIIFLTAVATDERRRFRGYEAGAVDYLLKPVDTRMLANKADVFFELSRHRQELARQRDELRLTLERLNAHGDNSPLAIVELDAEMRLRSWSKGAERLFGWNAHDVVGARILDLGWIHEDDVATFTRHVSNMLAGEQPRNVHMHRSRHKDGSIVECEWYYSALVGSGGAPISINAQILDVTERRHAEETQHLLVGELNHRVKNMLASVQAIASQTLRNSPAASDFVQKFNGRIQSLARANSMLSDATWQGASLHDLIDDQLQLGTIDSARLKISGPDLDLDPQAALHLALIIHELDTNANKYGALSTPEGKVDLNWTVTDDVLHLKWSESGGPPAGKTPSRKGFGTALIERSLKPHGGTAQATFTPHGIEWNINLPVPALSAPNASAVSNVNRESVRKNDAPAAIRANGEPPLTGKRLLVIEDEPLVVLEMIAILKESGAHMVGAASTREEALDYIERATLDGVFLDGNLQGMPVDDVARTLAERKVPFQFVSGYGRDHLPSAFDSVAVLTKPFAPAQLVDAAIRLAGQTLLQIDDEHAILEAHE